jgi:hypothetical protein
MKNISHNDSGERCGPWASCIEGKISRGTCMIMINQVYHEDFFTRKLYFNVKSLSATLASTNP